MIIEMMIFATCLGSLWFVESLVFRNGRLAVLFLELNPRRAK